jgi:hypothetical protein
MHSKRKVPPLVEGDRGRGLDKKSLKEYSLYTKNPKLRASLPQIRANAVFKRD